jgi:hypothetical protein
LWATTGHFGQGTGDMNDPYNFADQIQTGPTVAIEAALTNKSRRDPAEKQPSQESTCGESTVKTLDPGNPVVKKQIKASITNPYTVIGFFAAKVARLAILDGLSRPLKTSAPDTGALQNSTAQRPQAAAFVDLISRSLLELAIGIARGFIASGISRTRSTCRSPFSRLAPLT